MVIIRKKNIVFILHILIFLEYFSYKKNRIRQLNSKRKYEIAHY